MAKRKKTKPLTGAALIQKVKELKDLSKEEKARACGYVTVTRNKLERVNMMQFLNALLDAEGIELDAHSAGKGHGGRIPGYKVTVQSNGNVLIGSAYTKQLNLKPGDEIAVVLGRKHIKLMPVDEADEEMARAA
jgi:hypothetical protein